MQKITKAELLKQFDDYKIEAENKYLYLAADLDNYRKQSNKKIADIKDATTANVAIDFIDVADAFDLALQHTTDFEGINLIYKKFTDILTKYNISQIDVNEGDEFDSNIHDAISTVSGDEDNKVKYIVKKGYRMGDKVIRHAQVIVTKI